MRTFVIAISLSFLVGCATRVVSVPIHFRLVDHPDESRIELFYRNNSKSTVCISADYWPNQAGKLNQMSDRVFLVVSGERFPIEDFNTGYCIGETCARRVEPGEQISGSIPYNDFGLPERLRNEPKTLEFSPIGFMCR